MDDLKLSNFVSMIPDCLMTNDERTLFDWLVFKCSYNFDWYRHSITQVQRETGVKRKMQDSILQKFRDLGFLEMKRTYHNGNPYRSFYVHFRVLATCKVLGKLFDVESPTYNTMLGQFRECAAEQKKQTKSRSQTKADEEREAMDTARLNEALRKIDNTWKERVEMYNNGDLTDGKPKRGKTVTALHKSKPAKSNLRILLQDYDTNDIKNSFIAYADEVLRGNIETSQILPYFLKRQGGEFPVFGRFLDKFAADYSYKI